MCQQCWYNYNTASRAENVRRQGRPRKTLIRRDVTNDHHGGTNLFNYHNTISQFYPPRQNSSIHLYTNKFNQFSVVSRERGRGCIGKIRKRQHSIYITPNLYYHICCLPHCSSSYLIRTWLFMDYVPILLVLDVRTVYCIAYRYRSNLEVWS